MLVEWSLLKGRMDQVWYIYFNLALARGLVTGSLLVGGKGAVNVAGINHSNLGSVK